MDWSKVDAALIEASVPYDVAAEDESALKKKFVFPGAVLLVGRGGEIIYHKAFGCRSLEPNVTPMTKEMVFDIASLTKALVTTTLCMVLADNGLMSIDRRLSHIFQTFSTLGKERMSIRHLLNHTAGYPAHAQFYRTVAKANSTDRAGILGSRGAVEMVYNEIFRAKLENLPGKVTKYSDLGFILLGHAIEVAGGGLHLDKAAQKYLIQPLNLRSMGYIDLSKIRRRGLAPVTEVIAPTAHCSWRNRIMLGEVHDDNAWAMGGIAGHAGIFSSALDVHVLASELINCWHGRGKLVHKNTVRTFWKRDGMDPQSTWALGWDTPSQDGSASGKHFTAQAVGHLGYTGCSIWIDPERELDVILLSNRIHPSVENVAIKDFRPMLHDLVMETLGYSS